MRALSQTHDRPRPTGDAEPRPSDRFALGLRLRRLAHDLNGPLGSMRLDLQCMEECLVELDGPGAVALPEARQELQEIAANLALARRMAVDVVEVLAGLGRELAPLAPDDGAR